MTKMSELETDPLLPSGNWVGFYCYHGDGQKHKMEIELTFSKLNISGSGIDDVGSFNWAGKYNLTTYKAHMDKQYITHNVFYKGTIDENGIWGIWELKMDMHTLNGGFHIWPKKQNEDEKSEIVEEFIPVSKVYYP